MDLLNESKDNLLHKELTDTIITKLWKKTSSQTKNIFK